MAEVNDFSEHYIKPSRKKTDSLKFKGLFFLHIAALFRGIRCSHYQHLELSHKNKLRHSETEYSLRLHFLFYPRWAPCPMFDLPHPSMGNGLSALPSYLQRKVSVVLKIGNRTPTGGEAAALYG